MAAKGILRIKVLGDASGLDKALGGVTGSLGKLGGAAAAVFAGVQIVDFFKESAVAAMEDAKAKDVLHVAIKNVTGASKGELEALDSYIEKTQAATGFTEEELRPAMTKLVGATKDVGKAQDLLSIAMDTATARGTSLETVTAALEKAQNGNLAGLQRLGIATKDASGNALSYDQVLQNLAATYGGATSAAADTVAGKMERAKLMFGEMKESLGAALMPILEQFVGFITENMPSIEKIFGAIGEVIGAIAPIVGAVLPLISQLIEWIASLVSWIADKLVLAIDYFKDFPAKVAEGLSTAWTAISDFFTGIGTKISDFFTGCGEWLYEHGKSIIQGAWNGLKWLWEKVSGWFTSNFPANILKIFAPGAGWLVPHGKDIFTGLWNGLKEVWQSIVSWVTGVPQKIKDAIGYVGNLLFDAGKAVLQGLWNGMKSIWNHTIEWIKGLPGQISGWFKRLLGIESPSKVMHEIGENIMRGLAAGIKDTVPLVKAAIEPIAELVTSATGLQNGQRVFFGGFSGYGNNVPGATRAADTSMWGQTQPSGAWFTDEAKRLRMESIYGGYSSPANADEQAMFQSYSDYWRAYWEDKAATDAAAIRRDQYADMSAQRMLAQQSTTKNITINVTGNTGAEIGREIVAALATV